MNDNRDFSDKDMPCTFLSACLCGDRKSHYLWNNTEAYYDKLKLALNDIESDNTSDYLYFSFIALSSATLEYSLNFLYALYCFNKFHLQQYEAYLDVYKNVRFKGKLFILPHVLSEGKLAINEDCKYVKSLYKLIKNRNRLLHDSEEIKEFDFPDIHARQIAGGLFIPLKYETVEFEIAKKESTIENLTKNMCINIGEAMLAFYSKVILPFVNEGELKINEFVINQQVHNTASL